MKQIAMLTLLLLAVVSTPFLISLIMWIFGSMAWCNVAVFPPGWFC